MSDLLKEIHDAIATVREAESKLPLIVAAEPVLNVVRTEYPWYPERLLNAVPFIDTGVAYFFAPSLLTPDFQVTV